MWKRTFPVCRGVWRDAGPADAPTIFPLYRTRERGQG